MARHIQKRHRTWYATLDIPADVRAHFGGKRRFFKSLETHSETQALRRVPFLIAQWQAEITKAKGIITDPLEADVQWVKTLQAAERVAKDTAKTEDDYAGAEALRDAWVDFLKDMDHMDPARAEAVHKRATGEITPTSAHLDEWLATATDTPKNKDLKCADVRRLARQFPNTSDIGRKGVRQWRDQLVQQEGLKVTTVARLLSSCKGYWRFLQRIEVVSEDNKPFNDLPPTTKTKNAGRMNKADEPVAFEPEDVVRILRAAEGKGHQQMTDLISLGMWTGARIGELCALRVEAVNIAGRYFKIESAKTAAGVRTVPIHANLQATMERLCKDSRDGYVVTGQSENKYGTRTDALGTRFSRLKKSMGFHKGHNFHSIRRTVVTIMDNAGVPEGVAADIVGHAKKTMTYGLYSGGATLETKRAALAKLTYPFSR